MVHRRTFLKHAAGALAAFGGWSPWSRADAAADLALTSERLPSGARESAILHALPGKKPLIKKSFRPPNYETPVHYFNEPFTPNDAFFVRYHLASIPEIDSTAWKLRIGGDAVDKPLEFSLDELRRNFEPVELAALCLCSGNRRGLFQPHVSGVQWGDGGMGNALWKGVRLMDVLKKAGVSAAAVEVTVDGADVGLLAKTPDFVKSLPMSKALDENTLIAFEMNGAPLPHWNGFPVRLVVPGWTATYWVKHLTSIQVVSKPFDGFWMKTAYRIPRDRFGGLDPFLTQETDISTPITEMVVNSLVTNFGDGKRLQRQHPAEIRGVAWDGGHGLRHVEVSLDGGHNWREARLGRDYGRFSWRQWAFRFQPERKGELRVMIRASNLLGATQPPEVIWNPSGYHHNALQTLRLVVV